MTRPTLPRGQTAVEFALILPLFILLLLGIFDLGRAVYAFNTISNAAREGVRLGIVDQNVTRVQDRAVQHAVSLAAVPGDVDVAFLSADLSSTCPSPIAIGCVAQITVHYSFTAATPIIGNLVGVIDMASTTREPVERSFVSP
ncbi:MAG TPA: TadE family protein [Candidatus Limnocylindria bacterium]|nr:TadE family protein [Candidatus Limnocylindria bacterium]